MKASTPTNSLNNDLDHILSHVAPISEGLKNARIFVTGGTGFFGMWLLDSFSYLNQKLNLNASMVVLSRNPIQHEQLFRQKIPNIANDPTIELYAGDVTQFKFPKGNFTHVIHAATPASLKLSEENPLAMLDVITQGTRHTLEFAKASGAKRFLLTSSGAVYGKQPPEMTHVPEDFLQGPSLVEPRYAYGHGKRYAEHLCNLFHNSYGIETILARCWAFSGPHLPLDIHFAIGNFVRDAVLKRPIKIGGDGTPYRSYLDAADLAIWLWTLLLKGQPSRPYNVGSDQAVSIRELAQSVAGFSNIEVQIAKKPNPDLPAERYVPNIDRAKSELGLKVWIPLNTSIAKMIQWAEKSIKN